MQTILDMEPVENPSPKRPSGRAWRIVVVVLALHAVALGGFVVFQGCNRSEPAAGTDESPSSPPLTDNAAPALDAAQAGTAQPPPVAQPGSTALTPEERIPGQAAPPPSVPATPPDVAFAPSPEPPPPAPAEPPAPKVAKAPRAGSTYAVRKGDTLSRIAKRYSVSTRELADMNKIQADSSLKVGQKLSVPAIKAAASPAPRAPAAPKATAAKPTTGATHVVRAGETLTSIARQHGVTAAALMRANGITDPTKLKVGQKLKLPSGHGSSPPPNPSGDPLHRSKRLAT